MIETYLKESEVNGQRIYKTYTNIENLRLDPQNPRDISEEKMNDLMDFLSKWDSLAPVLVDARPEKEGHLIGGNMRLQALKRLGVQEVWIEFRNPGSDAEAFEMATLHNMQFGNYVMDKLGILLKEFEGELDLSKLEVNLADSASNLDKLLQESKADDVVEDTPPEVDDVNEPSSKVGEVYQLGRHRLMCGDSADIDSVQKLLNGNQPAMLFTDPPYGVDYQSRVDEGIRKNWGGIKNDNLKGEVLHQFLKDTVGIYGQTKYVCCNWQSVVDFWLALGKPNSMIIWDKGSIGLGAGYRNQHEIILFYGKLDHNSETNVWTIKRDGSIDYGHPTQKPVAIPARGIKNSSNSGDIILDVFGGSGSTLIACEQTNRTCYMMELDPKYCDVIRKRYWKFINGDNEEGWQENTPAII